MYLFRAKADWLKMRYQLKKCWHYPTHQGTVEIYSSISCRLNYCCSVPTEELRFVQSCEMCNLITIIVNSHHCNHWISDVADKSLPGLISTTLSVPVLKGGMSSGEGAGAYFFWITADIRAWSLPQYMSESWNVEPCELNEYLRWLKTVSST